MSSFLFGGGGAGGSTSLAFKAIGFGDSDNQLTGDVDILNYNATGSYTSGPAFSVGDGVMTAFCYDSTPTIGEKLWLYNVAGTFTFETLRQSGAGTVRPILFKVGDTQLNIRHHSSAFSHLVLADQLGNSTVKTASEGFCKIGFYSTANSGDVNTLYIHGTSGVTASAKFAVARINFEDLTALEADQDWLRLTTGGGATTVQHSFNAAKNNIYFFRANAAESDGSGRGVTFIGNATTEPSSSPTNGFLQWANSGGLKFRTSAGTIMGYNTSGELRFTPLSGQPTKIYNTTDENVWIGGGSTNSPTNGAMLYLKGNNQGGELFMESSTLANANVNISCASAPADNTSDAILFKTGSTKLTRWTIKHNGHLTFSGQDSSGTSNAIRSRTTNGNDNLRFVITAAGADDIARGGMVETYGADYATSLKNHVILKSGNFSTGKVVLDATHGSSQIEFQVSSAAKKTIKTSSELNNYAGIEENTYYATTTTSDATPTSVLTTAVADDSAYLVTAEISAFVSDATDYAYASCLKAVVARRSAGSAAKGATSTDVSYIAESVIVPAADIIVSGNNLAVQVTGHAGTTINWSVKLRTMKAS